MAGNSLEYEITGHTRLIGLLGFPVKQSRAPKMHNLAFAKAGIDLVYLTFDVTNDNLADAVKAMRVLSVAGFNVTMPNKQAILPLLDELSKEARIIGAVNTVSNSGGILKGYNTDALGFIMNLDEHGVAYKAKKVVVGGAGGAGSACAVQLALGGAGLIALFDIDTERAKVLADKINQNIPACKAYALQADQASLVGELRDANVYVDATPLGMEPREEECVFNNAEQIPPHITVCEICYAPVMTKLLKMAESRGCKIVTGIGMNDYQGAAAFKIWTGEDMPLSYVRSRMAKEDAGMVE